MSKPQVLPFRIATAAMLVTLTAGSAAAAPEAPGTAASAAPSADWSSIGPNGQAGAIAIAPSAPDHAALVPSYGAGLWKTDDAGSTWRQLPDPPGARNAGDANRVVIDPADPQHWWYAGTAAASAESVILETHDEGRTWSEAARFAGELLAFLAVDDDDSTLALATTTSPTTADVHTRPDSGSWTTQSIDTGAAIRQITSHGETLILSGYFAAWRLDSPGSGSVPVEIYRVSESTHQTVEAKLTAEPSDVRTQEEDVNQIWDIASTTSTILVKELGRGIVGSTDAGATWTEWDVPHDVSSISSNGDAFYLVRSDSGPRWADVTSDAGSTFTAMRIPDDGAIQHEFTTWADGSVTSANPRSGLYRTTNNGREWERIGVQGSSGLEVLASADQLFAGTEYGLASTTFPTGSTEWGATGGEATVGTATPAIDTAGAGHPLWKAVNAPFNELVVSSSTDGGKTWDERTSLFGIARELTVHPANPDLVILTWQLAARCGLHISRDGGTTWTTTLGDCLDAVVGDPSNPDRVWLGGPSGLFRSDDGGSTGTRVSNLPATAVQLDKHRIVIGGDALHVSDDDGATFTPSSHPSPASATSGSTTFTALVRSGPRLFAGFNTGTNTTGSGILVSADGGRTWEDFSTGLQNSEVLSLAVSPDGETLFAGTRNGGVHSTSLPPRILPTAASDTAHTTIGERVRIDVLGNDSGGDLAIDPTSVSLQSSGDAAWSDRVTVAGEGRFESDPQTGSVTFTPEASFTGSTGALRYRFANTDGAIAQAEIRVVVDAPTNPGAGSGAGENESESSDTAAGPLANTGMDPLPFLVAALAILTVGIALTLRVRARGR